MTRSAAIVGITGPSLSAEEAVLLRRHEPSGVILFRRNIQSPGQLADLVESIRSVVPDVLMMVDQEGGRVARLRPPHWAAHPSAAAIGALLSRSRADAVRAAFLSGALIGLEAAGGGFEVVCAPVLDRRIAGASEVVGDRAFSTDPDEIALLAGAMAEGLLAAGVQPVGKHAPGHGPATVDSHLSLPVLDTPEEADLRPFRTVSPLPWLMTAHIRFDGLDPERPATLSPVVLGEVIRRDLGFDGVLVSDDLAMEALSGSPGARAAAALAAGCDIALHCSGVLSDTTEVLEASGPPTEACLDRLARARAQAAEAAASYPGLCSRFDGMLAERTRLLAGAPAV
ncbi:beta-N-acetylhexosaminidase [Rhizosaccharibacter radicis]|uniref:beta-N-acetylhexosaminidase n=1 Tax=Rhizosaccharibacter radicis TaxID=2782605 RepID=A0ABT1VY03_9PROT|nr:beta-N-acetylhexosaminidase [Acetobacteraceae bacterium KSS12]